MPQLTGKEIGPVGYGLMGFTWRKTIVPEEQSFEAMRAAVKNGMNFWNGAEFYAPPTPPTYNSLTLLANYFEKYPEDADKVVISIKGAVRADGAGPDASPEGIRRSMDNCLKELKGRKKLDIFECARRDPNTPLEVSFGVLQKEYIDTGKLGGISLSEVRASTIHEAVKVAKIVAVEVELSLWSTDVLTNGIAEACAQYGIPLVAYSPIGRGMLSGQIKSMDDIPEGDFRRHIPRFQPENFELNLELVRQVEELAKKKGCTAAQLAVSWVKNLQKRPGMPTIIPIPGSTKAERVTENAKTVDLSDAEMKEIDDTISKIEVKGERYPPFVPMNG